MTPWLPLPEFLSIAGVSRRTYFRQRDLYQTRKHGKATLVSSASLPNDVRAKLEPLGEPRKELMRPSEPVCAPAPLFAAAEAPQGPGRRIVLQPEQERQAMERLNVLQPLLDFCNNPDARRFLTLRALQDGTRVTNTRLMVTHLSEQHGVPEATLWRWKKNFEEHGLPGLARKVREDKGRSQWAQRFPEAAKLITVTFLQPYATRQRAYDALVKDRARLGIAEAEMPSYSSVCNFLAALPAAPVVWAREGEQKHHERMSNYLQRKYTDMEPNEVWVADTMIHDAMVRNDYFGTCDNAPVRLQLTALMDMRSRKIVGYSFCLNGSSRSITSALIAAVKRYGPCKSFYCDNGKDFQKVGRFARPVNGNELLEEDMQAIERTGALRQLGINVQFCIKYHPQSKPIERFFRTLHLKLDAPFPHYTTGNAYLKPDATVAAAEKHGKLLRMQAPAEASPLLPASHFIRMASTWIEQDYNAQHKHTGRGMNGLTPDEVFAPALANRREIDLDILDTLLWERKRRMVRNCAVTIDNRRMVGATPFAAEKLYLANDQDVLVCYDPNFPDVAVVTDLDGHKLCDVQAEVLVSQSVDAGPAISAMLEGNRSRRNNMAASVRHLRKDVAGSGHQTTTQDLHERAMLPLAVGDTVITQPIKPRRIGNTSAAPKYAYEVAADVLQEEL